MKQDIDELHDIIEEMVEKYNSGCNVEGEWHIYDPKPFGYVYCFSNESMEGIFKIGTTKRTPEERLKEANKSDTFKPPTDYKLLYYAKCYDSEKKEKLIHKLLEEYRVNKKKEFFKCDKEKIKIIFDILAIEKYEPKHEVDVLKEKVKDLQKEIYKLNNEKDDIKNKFDNFKTKIKKCQNSFYERRGWNKGITSLNINLEYVKNLLKESIDLDYTNTNKQDLIERVILQLPKVKQYIAYDFESVFDE